MANIPSGITKDDLSRIVTLVFGTMDHGGVYWCYAGVAPSRYDEFKKLIASKNYNMQNFVKDGFGEIIVSGEGNLPPVDVTKQVAQAFNVKLRDMFADIDPQKAIDLEFEALSKKVQD